LTPSPLSQDSTLETEIVCLLVVHSPDDLAARHIVMIYCLWGPAVWMFQTGSWVL